MRDSPGITDWLLTDFVIERMGGMTVRGCGAAALARYRALPAKRERISRRTSASIIESIILNTESMALCLF